jgi:hypothetical protein
MNNNTKQELLSEFIRDKTTKSGLSKIKKIELIQTFNDWYKDKYGSRVNKSKELYDLMDKTYGQCRNTYWYGVKLVYRSDEYCNKSTISNITDIEEEDEDDEEMQQLELRIIELKKQKIEKQKNINLKKTSFSHNINVLKDAITNIQDSKTVTYLEPIYNILQIFDQELIKIKEKMEEDDTEVII